LIVGAAVRVLVVLYLYSPTEHLYSDSLGYVQRAARVAEGASLERYDAFYPPGTHLLLAIPMWLVGGDRTGLIAGAVLWTVLSALTPFFMWRYVRLILTPSAAALTAIFCALWPIHIAYAGHFMSETPALAFLCASLWLAERAHRRASPRAGLVAGVCGGIAAANRPALALNVLVGAFFALRGSRVLARHVLAVAVGAGIALVPVIAYASAATGHLTLSENSGLVFFMGHCDIKRVEAGPPHARFSFESPVTTQLARGTDVSFPDRDIWDQRFFYAQGVSCIAADGLGHARMLLRNAFDMGLATVPWPPSNDPIVRDIVRVANIGYVAALPFIVFGAIRLVRRRWPAGQGRGELGLLLQLSMVLVTAILFFGDPRYRAPYDVFGLALAASLIADRYLEPALRRRAAVHPDVRRRHAVQEHHEGVLRRRESAREVDADEAHVADGDGGAAVGADDDALQRAWRGQEDGARAR
jgi:4-amino-4-deoxy-L-arabinose transferase-like glycosyltransferase